MFAAPVDRRALSLAFLSFILVLLFINQYRVNQGLELLEQPAVPKEQFSKKPEEQKQSWLWNVTLHDRDYGLSDEQCNLAFPGLWENIDNVANHRNRIGNITEEDVDKSYNTDQVNPELIRVLIYDRQVHSASLNTSTSPLISSAIHY